MCSFMLAIMDFALSMDIALLIRVLLVTILAICVVLDSQACHYLLFTIPDTSLLCWDVWWRRICPYLILQLSGNCTPGMDMLLSSPNGIQVSILWASRPILLASDRVKVRTSLSHTPTSWW